MSAHGGKKRLQWQCRRGMLELDALLLRFLEKGYDDLPGELQAAFRKLLQEEDSRLFGWLIEAPHSVPREYAELAGRIRQAARR